MTRINPALRLAPSAVKPVGVGPVGEHSLLRFPAAGHEVKQLQAQLVAQGFLDKATGQFDKATEEAVKAYQAAKGLQVDGIVGQQTWGSFNGESNPPGAWMLKQRAAIDPGSTFDPRQQNPTAPGAPINNVNSVDLGPASGNSRGEQILDTARKYLGTHEGSGNSNPFSSALGRPPEAWCADFVSFCAKKAGLNLNTASAQGVQTYLEQHGAWKGKHNPQPGDALTFRWDGSNGWADHVGIVERVYQRNGKLYVDTIEGNSSDQVRRKTYAADDPVIKGFGTIV